MIKINLLAVKEAKKKATAQNQLIIAGVVIAAVVIGVVYVAISRHQSIARLTDQMNGKKKDLARLQAIQKKTEQFKKDNEHLQQR